VKDMVGQILASDEVHVEARGLTESTLESIRRMEGVLGLERTEGGFEAKVRVGAEVRPAIAKAITESGAQLFAIGGGSRMLEKAYIEALKSDRNQVE
jgi:hypothetical protein